MTFCRSLLLVLLFSFQFLLAASLTSQTKQDKADLIITGGTVITMDGSRTIYDDGAVIVKGDTIVAVGPGTDLTAKFTPAQTIDARGKLVLPGLINGHTHVPMTLF